MHVLSSVLTPGTHGYALLRLGTVAGLFGLQYAVRHRGRGKARDTGEPVEPTARSDSRAAHPRSKKKRQKRRR